MRVIIVIDRSGSMSGMPFNNAKRFGASKNPSSVWGFEWECNRYNSVDEIPCGGGTRIAHALRTVFDDMKDHQGKQQLYFITDAQDNVTDTDEKELVSTWKQIKNATGKAIFFGNPGPAKPFLENFFDVDVLSTEDLKRIEKALEKHAETMKKVGDSLVIVFQEIDDVKKDNEISQIKLLQIEEKINGMYNELEEEKQKAGKLKKEMDEICVTARDLDAVDRSRKLTRQEFEKFKVALKDCVSKNKVARQECRDLRDEAIRQQEDAHALKEKALAEEKRNINNTKKALQIWNNSCEKVHDLESAMSGLEENGDFATSQVCAAHTAAQQNADSARKNAKKEVQQCFDLAKDIEGRSKDADQICTEALNIIKTANVQSQRCNQTTLSLQRAANNAINAKNSEKVINLPDEGPVIEQFLMMLELSRFEVNFKIQDVLTKQNLKELTKGDLKDMGIEPLGPRNKIWAAIARIQ